MASIWTMMRRNEMVRRTEQGNNRADKDVGASYLDHPCANDYHGD